MAEKTVSTPSVPSPQAVVTMREITKANLRDILRLKTTPYQEQFVATNAVSLAQAHFEEKAFYRAFYADETPVGFMMLEITPGSSEYYLWRFMIDQRYQKLGFGRQALQLIIDYVRAQPGAKLLSLSYVKAEGGPQPFYERMGFKDTGEIEDDEYIMHLDLS